MSNPYSEGDHCKLSVCIECIKNTLRDPRGALTQPEKGYVLYLLVALEVK